MKEIEIWADSFHEGVWCCKNTCSKLRTAGFSYDMKYINGFIPCFNVYLGSNKVLEMSVYGSYKSWDPIPSIIKDLISTGKPDFIAYDPEKEKILFAVEETAATPTGNQAMQRLERQYGSARAHIPYWYFVSEYGEHVDGHVRRDNIWPSIAAIKLSIYYRVPSIVLHYSDIDNIEDYAAGNGLDFLFLSIARILENVIKGYEPLSSMESLISNQYYEMLKFILSEFNNVIDFLPSENLLKSFSTASSLARQVLKNETEDDNRVVNQLLVWPLITDVPNEVIEKQKGKELIKHDDLAELLEKDVTDNKAYILSNNASSGKPPTEEQLFQYLKEQQELFSSCNVEKLQLTFNMRLEDFPQNASGRRNVTTSKNIVYLYDRWIDLKHSIEKAYPRLKDKLNKIDDNRPVFLYMSNSIKARRVFGDPFTGQLTGYSVSFGKFDTMNRAVIAYFPHQVYANAVNENGKFKINKGMTVYTELTDYIIFNGGVAVALKDKEII